uniref:Putative Large exoprotein n=1 Tax=Angiostrongylus cantonensis TaxID=6313 RepID=C7BVU6_ANGCA|nr:putative Large exoprotein [Angiostrongylus cantonensis]
MSKRKFCLITIPKIRSVILRNFLYDLIVFMKRPVLVSIYLPFTNSFGPIFGLNYDKHSLGWRDASA